MNRRTGWAGALFGFAMGCVVTLGLIAAQDHGGPGLPRIRQAGASPSAETTRPLFLAGPWSTEFTLNVDGTPVTARAVSGGAAATIPVAGTQLEVVSRHGLVWSTRLTPSSPETLEAALGGEILVEVEPQGPTGVLHVDGVPAGEAPGTVSEVAAGWHTVAVVRDGSPLFMGSCQVVPGEATRVTVPPVPARGQARLLVRSRTLGPSGYLPTRGDEVTVDAAAAGSTPCEQTVDAGFHSVCVRRPGAQDLVLVVCLQAGETREVEADFGREDHLSVAVQVPPEGRVGQSVAVAVRAEAPDGAIATEQAELWILCPGQSTPVGVPLVASGSDDRMLVGLIPAALITRGEISGYAAVTDALGRTGFSELFAIPVVPGGPAAGTTSR